MKLNQKANGTILRRSGCLDVDLMKIESKPSDASELCEHLRPILKREMLAGNEIKEIVKDGWPKCPYEVNLGRPILESATDNPVEYWTFSDPHYPDRARGYSCNEHKHGISSP